MCREVKRPTPIEQQWEHLIIQALHLETGSWLIHLLWMCLLYEVMAGGLLWCNHWFHRALSGGTLILCHVNCTALQSMVLPWLGSMLAEGVLMGKALRCFPKWSAIWKGWEAGCEKALQKVCIFIHWVSSDPGKHPIYGKSKGAQILHFWAQTCICHMPLPTVMWNINIFRDLSLKRRTLKKWRPRSEWAAELVPCTWPYCWTRAGPCKCIVQPDLLRAALTRAANWGGDLSHERCSSF